VARMGSRERPDQTAVIVYLVSPSGNLTILPKSRALYAGCVVADTLTAECEYGQWCMEIVTGDPGVMVVPDAGSWLRTTGGFGAAAA
jgi:hypothetical protein